jgi:hypothetical protein
MIYDGARQTCCPRFGSTENHLLSCHWRQCTGQILAQYIKAFNVTRAWPVGRRVGGSCDQHHEFGVVYRGILPRTWTLTTVRFLLLFSHLYHLVRVREDCEWTISAKNQDG